MGCRCSLPPFSRRCHCRACCLTFTGVSAFDRHIYRGEHRAPGERGLVQTLPGIWGWPGTRPSRAPTRQGEAP